MNNRYRGVTKAAVIVLSLFCATAAAVAADQTWRLVDSPIVIATDTTIAPGDTVTIEPGVVVQMENGATLFVNGNLMGAGTASQPISFTGGAESFVVLEVAGSVTLSHAVIDVRVRPWPLGALEFSDTTFDAFGNVDNYGVGYFLSLVRCTFNGAHLWVGAGTIRIEDTNFLNDFVEIGGSILRMNNVSSTGSPYAGVSLHSFKQPVYVDNVSVSNAAGPGIDIVAGNFIFGSNVQLFGNEYPVQLGGAGILPGSTLPASGNLNNFIKVEFASNGVWSMAWADPGIPYAMTGGQYHTGTLKILPGVTVLLEPDFTVWDDDSIVDARGLPDNPVRFEQLVPGQPWQGLQYFHRFENCVIDGGQAGARFHSATYPGHIDNCIIRNNDFGMQNDALVRKTRFLDNAVGAWDNDIPAALESLTNPNSFAGNGLAIDYVDHSIDARFNWFGDPSGPNSPSNPGGSGDPVDAGVSILPFLNEEPNFDDHPPMVWLYESPRRENAGQQYSSFVDPGTKVIVSWEAQDEVGITGHRIEFFNGWENTWSIIAELPGEVRSFEWTVPDVGQVVNSSFHRLRVIATDPAGQEGWDEHFYFIPTGDEPGTLTVTGMPPGPFVPGQSIGPICVEANGVDPYVSIVAELSYDGDRRHIPLGSGFVGGCLVLSPTAPFVSTDTARIRVNTSAGQNMVNYFFSDYFTIRPDPRLGDAPPTITLTSPVGGETFDGGGIVPIHWTATDDDGIRSFGIQTSTDGGRTWHFIAEDLSPAASGFDWQLPSSGGIPDVRVRVMVRDMNFQTSTDGADVTFVVLPDPTCSSAPGEVHGVSALDSDTIIWSPMGGNVAYALARGDLAGLGVGAPADCAASGLTATMHDDLEVPASGAAFYYLVNATNACGSGPWGPPGQTRVTTCP